MILPAEQMDGRTTGLRELDLNIVELFKHLDFFNRTPLILEPCSGDGIINSNAQHILSGS